MHLHNIASQESLNTGKLRENIKWKTIVIGKVLLYEDTLGEKYF